MRSGQRRGLRSRTAIAFRSPRFLIRGLRKSDSRSTLIVDSDWGLRSGLRRGLRWGLRSLFRSPRFLKIEDYDEDCDQDCDQDYDEDYENDFVVVLNRSPQFRTKINRSPRWQIEDYDPGLRYDRSPRKIFPECTHTLFGKYWFKSYEWICEVRFSLLTEILYKSHGIFALKNNNFSQKICY